MLVVVVFNGLKFNQIYDFLSNELLFLLENAQGVLKSDDRTLIIENKTFKPRFDESDPLIQEIYLKEIE